MMSGRPPEKPAPLFGSKLAALRKAQRLTQPELGELLGISVKTVDYYERRAKNPSIEFVRKVSKALNTSIGDLVGEEEGKKKPGPLPSLHKQMEQIQKLARPKQQHILSVLEAFIAQNANGH